MESALWPTVAYCPLASHVCEGQGMSMMGLGIKGGEGGNERGRVMDVMWN